MTLQIGLVGTDGIVLASDTKFVSTDNEAGISHTFSASKVRFNDSVLAASAGSGMSLVAAKRILTELSNQEHKDPRLVLEAIGHKLVQQASQRKRFEVMVVRRADLSHIWHLNVDSDSQCDPLDDRCVAGHAANASVFFTERYYQRKHIRELALLGAYVVVQGARLNPGGIGGLEVIFCRSDGFHRLSATSVEALVDKINETDARLGDSFSTYSQEFTYGPDMVG